MKKKKRIRQYNFPEDFVLHSLRHTCLTRLGDAGADAFTIMKLAGDSSVTVSQRYYIRRRSLWNAHSTGWRRSIVRLCNG